VVIPLLIPYRCVHTVPVIRVVSERANAKEALLALQEILERLSNDSEQEDDDEEQEGRFKDLSPAQQLDRVVSSYGYGETTAQLSALGEI
jgi:hypothetical protein